MTCYKIILPEKLPFSVNLLEIYSEKENLHFTPIIKLVYDV